MAEMTPPSSGGKTDDTSPSRTNFATYLEAREEAIRRRLKDAGNGFFSRIEKSPYGEYVVRTLPIEILADPDMQRSLASNKPSYRDL